MQIDWGVVSTIVTAIGTAAIAILAYFQWRVGSKQTNLLTLQHQLSERQLALEENYRLITQKPLILIPASVIMIGGRSITVQIQNSGNIPIHDIKFFFDYQIVEKQSPISMVTTSDIKTKIINPIDDISKIVHISELCPQRALNSSRVLSAEIMRQIVDITNHNTKLDSDKRAENLHHRIYFIVYGAIKYKGTNNIEDQKIFFELVEFVPEYSHKDYKIDGKKISTPHSVPFNVNFLGLEYPAELSDKNRATIIDSLDSDHG